IGRIDEADAGDEEEGGVDFFVVETVDETVPARAEAARQNLVLDRGFLLFHPRVIDLHVATPGDALRTIERGPGHHLSVHVLARVAALLPNAGVWFLPALADDLGDATDELLHGAV